MAFHIAVHPEECWDALRTRRKLLACVLMVGGGPTSSPGWGMGQRWDHHSSDEYNNDDNETQVITSPRDTPGDEGRPTRRGGAGVSTDLHLIKCSACIVLAFDSFLNTKSIGT